ncbi:MAG: aldo/keto reductase [Flavobacteriales bacterium]|nr:aldo/keto reductase [Flavobacteriales bacterium]
MKNKIILGTVQFGLDYGINNSNGKPSQDIVNELLDTAFQKQVRVLDTAEAYGNSQEVIGKYHKQSSYQFKIITKFSSTRTDLPINVKERVKANIKTLGVDSLYCYMFHNYADFKSYYSEFAKDIIEIKKEGLIKKLGVSIYTNEELEDLLNYDSIDVIQLPFNLLDNSKQRASVLRKAKAKGIEIHTRSVFLQGLFFKALETIPEKIKPISNSLKEIKEIAKSNNIELSRLALNYAYQQDFIDSVLIGVDTVKQLSENIALIENPISTEVMEKVNEIDVEEKLLLNPSNWN